MLPTGELQISTTNSNSESSHYMKSVSMPLMTEMPLGLCQNKQTNKQTNKQNRGLVVDNRGGISLGGGSGKNLKLFEEQRVNLSLFWAKDKITTHVTS